MILKFRPRRAFGHALALGSLSALFAGPAYGQAPAGRSLAREVAALLEIAQGEYGLAVRPTGVDSVEYDEARALLEEARELAAPLLAQGERGRALSVALDSAEVRLARYAAASSFEEAVEQARRALTEGWRVTLLPRPEIPPSTARGGRLYGQYCASCHGVGGAGDGEAAAGMDPPPTDFTDVRTALEISPARVYQVTSFGIPGTGMAGWRDRLSQQDRWDLTAYVLQLGFTDAQRRQGAELYATYCEGCHSGAVAGSSREGASADGWAPSLADLEREADLTGLEFLAAVREGRGGMPGFAADLTDSQQVALLAYVRSLVGSSVEAAGDVASVVERVERELERAVELHSAGEYAAARSAALRAYMTFERLEDDLRVRAPNVTRKLEAEFMELRVAVGDRGADPRPLYTRLRAELGAAVRGLDARTTIWRDFLQSLVIIVREGVEATLIITALLAFLVRSGNARHRKSIYSGTAVAIGASLATAVAVQLIFRAAPAGREVLEGVTMLIAVLVLFLVSYWLVSKVEHKRWERYIRGKVSLALSSRNRFALSSVAFLAVYREGFETVLFYQALMGGASSGTIVLVGFVLGLVLLVGLCVGIYRVGVRVPLRPFFALTSAILYYMAFVFAGSGVRELQEAGVVSVTPVAGIPTIDLLGVYPTVESLAVQAVLAIALVLALSWSFMIVPARARVQESTVGPLD
jgi:high-affinity iron transporter